MSEDFKACIQRRKIVKKNICLCRNSFEEMPYVYRHIKVVGHDQSQWAVSIVNWPGVPDCLPKNMRNALPGETRSVSGSVVTSRDLHDNWIQRQILEN